MQLNCQILRLVKIDLNSMKPLYTLVTLLFLFASCKSTYLYTDIHPEKVAFKNTENIEFTENEESEIMIRTAFIGNAIDYSIFQVEIENESEIPISLSYEDVRLVHQDGFQRNAHHKYNFIKNLKREKKNVKKQKKANTIGNILFGALTVASIASGGGGINTADAVLYGAESFVYIADDRRAFNAMEGTIEDEIKYIEDWVLFESIIPSEGVLTKDVMFPSEGINDDFDIQIRLDGKTYKIPYDCVIREERR